MSSHSIAAFDQAFSEFHPYANTMAVAAQIAVDIGELSTEAVGTRAWSATAGSLIQRISALGAMSGGVETSARQLAVSALAGLISEANPIKEAAITAATHAMEIAALAYTPLVRAQIGNSRLGPAGRTWGSGDWEVIALKQLDELDALMSEARQALG